MNRGSCVPPEAMSETVARFNEAPIHESGKFALAIDAPRVDRASMRPRFMNRGSQVKWQCL